MKKISNKLKNNKTKNTFNRYSNLKHYLSSNFIHFNKKILNNLYLKEISTFYVLTKNI